MHSRACHPWPILLLVLTACPTGSPDISTINRSPTPEITFPEDGATVVWGNTLEARGMVDDPDSQDTVFVVDWLVNDQVFCDDASTDEEGQGLTVCSLQVVPTDGGLSASIILQADDGHGGSGEDVISLLVDRGEPPVAMLTSPEDLSSVRAERTLSFEGTCQDPDTESTDLLASFEANGASLGLDVAVESGGLVNTTGSLDQEGEVQVCLVCSDPAGNRGSDCALVTVTPPNTAPQCTILEPPDGATGPVGANVSLEGQCVDLETPSELLAVEWLSDQEAGLPSPTPDADGWVASTARLEVQGTHTLTLRATDDEGAIGQDQVVYSVGGGPTVFITTPGDLDAFGRGESILFEGTYNDLEDICSVASVVWSSDVDGVLNEEMADTGESDFNCFTSFETSALSDGDHEIYLTVTDHEGHWNRDSVFINVGDCLSTWYRDLDGDGYGDPYDTRDACTCPAGYVDNWGDCDDSAGSVNPAMSESCNGVDDNCNGEVDEGVGILVTWYRDADGDGYGDPDVSVTNCELVYPGYVTNKSDCDDTNVAINPLRTEVCDGVDEDCDGVVDDGFSYAYGTLWYPDLDWDGYGTEGAPISSCEPVPYYANNTTDCNDSDASVHPGADEICNLKDDDCDAEVDEADAVDAKSWYEDLDYDGYGTDASKVTACSAVAPSGFVSYGGDCDDADATRYPTAMEACDGIDNDCDGKVDDGYSYPAETAWYRDADSDGYGFGTAATTGCEPPPGYVDNASDCDDGDRTTNPGQAETCNSKDDDCDGSVDEADGVGVPTWYTDLDGDGYGETATGVLSCTAPEYGVEKYGDCDDGDRETNPGVAEACDGKDNDCDGGVDEVFSYSYGTTFYTDEDRDGWGIDSRVLTGCEAPEGWSALLGDCDDARADVNPGLEEVCDRVDNDCDDEVDEAGAVGAVLYYQDLDADGYGPTDTAVTSCEVIPGYATAYGDCDDARADINPGAAEVCDGVDQDCDEVVDDGFSFPYGTTWYLDGDGDGYGTPGAPRNDCDAVPGYAINDEDCDDSNADVNPGRVDVCNLLDDNCDGEVDEVNPWTPAWYLDTDGDGFGQDGSEVVDCDQPAGYAFLAHDCDDTHSGIHPDASETCDGVDNDCDGDVDDGFSFPYGTTWYLDGDGDGYGTTGAPRYDCDAVPGYAINGSDCDDADSTVNPGQAETCNTRDDDCDGSVDEPDAVDASTWYEDHDGDGYGLLSTAVTACAAPACAGCVYVLVPGDCDDAFRATSPAATEICDGMDNDCDAAVDEADASDASTWYLDADADGYGTADVATTACAQPEGWVSDDRDCDDFAADAFPGGAEVCDEDDTDEDCNGLADDADAGADGRVVWYTDTDEDGFGYRYGMVSACDAPEGYANNALDCDDSNYYRSPAWAEVCDAANLDEDCDSLADDGDPDVDETTLSSWYPDADRDGYGASSATPSVTCDPPSTAHVADGTDCNDASSAVHPGADEVCDVSDVDEDCNGLADDEDYAVTGAATWYRDADADGYGSPYATRAGCEGPTGYVSNGADCDDTTASARPYGVEVCDRLDNDCDGTVDEDDASDASTWYRDADGDGHGVATGTTRACDAPEGYATSSDDCDDGNYARSPGWSEVCDAANLDEDCDGLADDLDTDMAATTKTAWYTDADRDGYGALTATATWACEAPSTAHAADHSDCNDASSAVHPGATEVCDAYDVDEDCNGLSDDGDYTVSGGLTWYRDSDGDGYGSPYYTRSACGAPPGYVENGGDCNDSKATAHPGGTEVCDGVDNDCDGSADGSDSADATTWYRDADGDGHGAATGATVACDPPTGYAPMGDDCDDSSFARSPDWDEVCDDANVDEDCDGKADDLDTDLSSGARTAWYTDADRDGYGSSSATAVRACDSPGTAYSTDNGDCNDASASINPAAEEVCDDRDTDEDCNGYADSADWGVTGGATWYRDADGDGYGTPYATRAACEEPTGYVENAADCDDTRTTARPGYVEVCDAVDNDCDGTTDESDAADARSWYKDADGDGYGLSSGTVVACDKPDGYGELTGDCDDGNASRSPGLDEVCDPANVDEDCDGRADDLDSSVDATTKSLWYVDADRDGYGTGASTGRATCDSPGSDYVSNDDDCNDASAAIHPGATETCNSLDDDCNGYTDDADYTVTGGSTWYRDGDGDGYGTAATYRSACARPTGYVSNDDDCNDATTAAYPGGTERCDSVDNDCDGTTDESDAVGAPTWYVDGDGDGYGTSSSTRVGCTAPSGYVSTGTDCNDGYASIHPGASEACNTVDDDCDGTVDEGTTGTTYYRDADGDGYGVASSTTITCTSTTPSGYSTNDDDCDDTSSAAYPGRSEACDGADNDCDGTVDEGVKTTFYRDVDGDGYGVGTSTHEACSAPSGYAGTDDDCDDATSSTNPGASERCNAIDDDCDGTIDDSAGCPCTVDWYGATPYMFCQKSATWSAALAACNSYGYELAEINDSAENTWINGNAYPSSTNYWFGANDLGREGTWQTEYGANLLYTQWHSGEPNNGLGGFEEDCAHVYSDGTWNDGSCTSALYYVCEAYTQPTYVAQVLATADDALQVWIDGVDYGSKAGWGSTFEFAGGMESGEHVIAVKAWDTGSVISGFIANVTVGGATYNTGGDSDGWVHTVSTPTSSWTSLTYDDSGWFTPIDVSSSDVSRYWGSAPTEIRTAGAGWVWHGSPRSLGTVWFRLVFTVP